MVLFEGDNRREKIIVLLTMCFALFMAMLDNTVVNVALPTLSRKLGAGVSELQWIVDGYVLALASLLLTGGIFGDRYGRKRTFLSGLAIFTFSSLACGLSQNSGQLIAFRALQGVGAALLLPGTLSILTVTFPPHERAKAIGMWAGMSGLALALGPTLGGWMIEQFGWESVFFLNVPIGIAGFLIGSRVIKESRAPHARQLDIPGLFLGSAALFSVTFGLIEVNQRGWGDSLIIGSLILGGLLIGAFLTWERRSPHPMMPLSLFKIPAFSAGNAVAFSVTFAMFGVYFFLTLYLQLIRGYSPLETGVRFLPMTGMIVFAAPNSGRIASRIGSRLPMTIGLSLTATGMFLFSRLSATTPFYLMVPVMMMMGFGMGSTMTPMTAAVMNAVGHERAGLGSAMTNTSRESGGVFGIAFLGTLLTTRLKASLGTKLAALGIVGSQKAAIVATAGHGRFDPSVIQGIDPAIAGKVRLAFQSSFLTGYQLASVVAAGVLAFAAIVTFIYIPSGAPHREELPESGGRRAGGGSSLIHAALIRLLDV